MKAAHRIPSPFRTCRDLRLLSPFSFLPVSSPPNSNYSPSFSQYTVTFSSNFNYILQCIERRREICYQFVPKFCLPHFFLPLYPKRELINMEPHLACSLLRLFRQRKPNLNFGKLKIPTDLSGKYLKLTSNFTPSVILCKSLLSSNLN